jgi:hypothetical protein
VFTDVTIVGNTSGAGGGGIDNRSPYLTLTGAAISGNISGAYGGGLYTAAGSGTVLTNVCLENNVCSAAGGAIANVGDPDSTTRTVIVITNGIIRNNSAGSGGAMYNTFNLGPGTTKTSDNTVLYVALTNVLIADNSASASGGAIYNLNPIASTSSTDSSSGGGKGIELVMNNVTIAGNTATTGQGGGIYIPAENKNASNKVVNRVEIIANNCIIWGNTAPGHPGGNNIYNPTQSRLTLTRSLAEDGSYNGTSISFSGSPFAVGGYTLASGANALIDIGNPDYPDTEAKLIDGSFSGDTSRENTFKTLIRNSLFSSPRWIEKDVTAAEGPGNDRSLGSDIDVGAYETQ